MGRRFRERRARATPFRWLRLRMQGNYSVTVTNGIGNVTSSMAVVAVGSTITTNPTNLSLRPAQTALFGVSAQGLSPFTYQWYQIPAGGMTGVAIAGATSNLYTTPGVDLTYNGAKYYAIVTDSCPTPLTSSDATLTVTAGNTGPTIVTQPVGVTVTAGGTTSFSVVATGTPALTYQWYRIPAGQTTGVAIGGATSATYNVPATATATTNDQDKYYVVVTNGYGQAVSDKATLAVGNGISAADNRAAGDAVRGCRSARYLPGYSGFELAVELSMVRSASGKFDVYGHSRGDQRDIHGGSDSGHADWFCLLRGGEQRDDRVGDQQLGGTVCRTFGAGSKSMRCELVGIGKCGGGTRVQLPVDGRGG